jgi:preprotein translocase subunit SecB
MHLRCFAILCHAMLLCYARLCHASCIQINFKEFSLARYAFANMMLPKMHLKQFIAHVTS